MHNSSTHPPVLPIQSPVNPAQHTPATSLAEKSPGADVPDIASFTGGSTSSTGTRSSESDRPRTPVALRSSPLLPPPPQRLDNHYYMMSRTHHKPLTAEDKKKAIDQFGEKIQYSPRYSDDHWEYRHVILPKQLVRFCPQGVLVEDVWRGLGIRQSPGWEMYMRHDPEPHVLLFRRQKNYDQIHPPFAATTAAPLINPIGGGRK